MDFVSVIWLVAIVALGIGIPLTASRSDRFSRVLMIGLPIVTVVMILDVIAISTDFHDADGIFDCWPSCSTWQHVVGWTLWVGALFVLVFVIAVVLRETLRSRSR